MNESAYWDLRDQGVRALHQAKLAEAAEAFDAARRVARDQGLSELAERAYCNWAAVQLESSQGDGLREGLSLILGQARDPKARQLAAYYLASCHRSRGSLRAARHYAEMSVRLAESARDCRGEAASLHLLGVLRLGENRLGQARENLRKSLEVGAREGASPHTLMTTSTLGYCLSLTGDRAESLWLLDETLEEMQISASRVYEPSIRLNLGFASLEWGRFDEALDHGKAALAAIEGRESVEAKFVYYLLGEACVQSADGGAAQDYFEILENRYYPQHPGLSELLLSCRTFQFLNWLGH